MKHSYLQASTVIFVALIAYLFHVLEQIYAPNTLPLMYGYLLLYTGYREHNLEIWQKYANVDEKIVYPPTPVPEIAAEDFSYETMQKATHNFRYPAVVRGLFKNTRAVKLWATKDYLPSVLGNFVIPIVRNAVVGTLQDNRELVNFGEAFHEMYDKSYSKEYIFFPVKSRFTFNGSSEGSAEALQHAVDDICRKDMELNRLWPGFATKTHHNYIASQFVIGKSTETFTNQSTGSDWHCAGGNNWFVQIAGRKYWEFIEPRYSHYLHPLKGGFFNMWTSNKQIARLQKHIPRRSVTLEPGDMVYNPDWTWHKITNYGGLTIGIPLREINITLTFQNNWYFTTIVLTNKALTKFGLSLGGYPPPNAATEADN